MTSIHKTRFRDTILTRKIRPAALAELSGVDKSVIYRILNAPEEEVLIHYRTLFQLAGALNVAADYLRHHTDTSTMDRMTLEFKADFLGKKLVQNGKILTEIFLANADASEIRRQHAQFNALMAEYLQAKQALQVRDYGTR